MKQVTRRPISETSSVSKPKKIKRGRTKALTNIEYFAGIYLNATLGKITNPLGSSGMNDLKTQAYEFAEFMLQDDKD